MNLKLHAFFVTSMLTFGISGMLGKADNPEADHGNPKLVTNEEWAKKLTPEQYFCAREGGTEPVRKLVLYHRLL
jgi:hypothetical protein